MGSKSQVFAGRSVSRGIGVGSAICLFGNKRQFFKSNIEPSEREAEITRFRQAVLTADKQLVEIVNDGHAGEGQASIFETHRLFLKDGSLLKKIETTIREEKVNSEWAVSTVIDEYSTKYRNLSDKHLREKYIDLEDVGERLIAALGGESGTVFEFDVETVVVAKEINPSTLIEIASARPAALVTENGGWTSHTFILARELGIPAVTGVAKLMRRAENGERIIVDGFRGLIVIDPSRGTLENYQNPDDLKHTLADEFKVTAEPIVETLDSEKIRICANLDLVVNPSELERVNEFGIGLYRSEYLFKRYSGYPTEDKQFEKYREVLELAGDADVKIRTFDLSLGETIGGGSLHEKNPALGMRGIRLSLRDESQFRVQIRALLRAGHGKKLGIVVPMVTDLDELIRARKILDEEREYLSKSGVAACNPSFGAMIEVPAAVFLIDKIFEIVDFVNLGTNDLVQYLLAVDRDNDNVAQFFRTLHPAVIASLRIILESAARCGKEAVVCGEMAGGPLYVPLLIGLGARTLSMNLGSAARICGIISQISSQEAREIAGEVGDSYTADSAESLIRKLYGERWPHIPHFTNYAGNHG